MIAIGSRVRLWVVWAVIVLAVIVLAVIVLAVIVLAVFVLAVIEVMRAVGATYSVPQIRGL